MDTAIQHLPTWTLSSSLTIAFAILLGTLVRRALTSLERHGHLSAPMALRLRAVVRWVLVVAVSFAVLQQTGVFAQAWAVVSATLAALAVAFVASWSVLSNATAALLIRIFKPFRIGDRISLREPDGRTWAEGTVSDLSLMFVTLTTDAGEFEHFPASLVFQRVTRVRGATSSLPSTPGAFYERSTTAPDAPAP